MAEARFNTGRKGDYGQELVWNWLFERGHFPTDWRHKGPHPIDMFCVRKDGVVYAVDVKAKARRKLWRDTGIEYSHFNTYYDIEKNNRIDVWIFFVDHWERAVYGATLAELRAPRTDAPGCKPGSYPRIEGNIIYFPLDTMKLIFNLTSEQCVKLRELSKSTSGDKQAVLFEEHDRGLLPTP